jgi:hypothetical protein
MDPKRSSSTESLVTLGKRQLNLVQMGSGRNGKRARLYTSFELGGLTADIIVDQKTDPPIHHWIIQKIGSAEILYWGQEYTYEQAESAARSCMQSLLDRQHRIA